MSPYTLRVTAGPSLAPAARAATLCTPLRFFRVRPSALTRLNFVVEATLAAAPWFLMVAVAVKVSEGSTLMGASVRAATMRSGFGCTTAATFTVPAALVQLLASEASGTTPAASMHARAV